jgi:hypothetical protein
MPESRARSISGRSDDTSQSRARTAFFFVTLPEALPIAVIRGFIAWFTDSVSGSTERGWSREAFEMGR